MNTSATAYRLANDLETALSGLVKLCKALKFYPANHPAVVSAATESCAAFQPLLTNHDPCPCQISKDGFSLAAQPLAPNNFDLTELARQLAERQARQLLFLPELSSRELLLLATQLTRSTEQLHRQKGLQKQLNEQGNRSIRINQTDLAKTSDNVPQRPTGLSQRPLLKAEQQPRSLEPTAAIEQMRNLLELMKETLNDEQYLQALHQIMPLAAVFFSNTGIAGLLALFNLLVDQQQDPNRSSVQNDAAAAATEQLINDQRIQQLVNAVADPDLKASQRRALARILIGLQMKVAPELFKQLVAERDAPLRRHYSGILARMGTPIFGLLEAALNDPLWFVVRNAVTVLGETRLEDALPLLEKVALHPEVRVRRALIRALGAIGGKRVIPLLVRLSRDEHPQLHQPAIMALGTLGDPKVIPALCTILKKTDLRGKKTQLKLEVIKALAATGSPQAIIPLLQLARRPNRLQRKSLERLRAEAILCLGQLGNQYLLPTLSRLPNSGKGPVSRALQQTTAQLAKVD